MVYNISILMTGRQNSFAKTGQERIMFRTPKLSKNLLVFFVSLILIATQVSLSAELVYGASDGSFIRPSGDTILAFSSDVHNCPGNESARRLGAWIDTIKGKYGRIEAMGFCGDMANSAAGSTAEYWTLTKTVMDTVRNKGLEGIYTTGNHEFYPGDIQYDNGVLTSATNQTLADRFKVCTSGKEGNNYRIFCLGSAAYTQEYRLDDMGYFENYMMDEVGKNKPTIVVTHYPLHWCISNKGKIRTTANADLMIDLLNEAATNGTPDDPSDDRKIIFLWGHNHSEHDPYYDQIFIPGEDIRYEQNNYKKIKFYYCAAGCMCDAEYGGPDCGSASVKGKGLVLQIRADDGLGFAYYNADGKDVTENDNYPKIVVSEKSSSDPVKRQDEASKPDQNGSDGTALGPGASAAIAENAILNMVSDKDPKGTVFGKLALNSPKQAKTSIDLSWKRIPNAKTYVIYGNKCGNGIKPVKLAVTAGNKQTIKAVKNHKLKSGTYYKFIIVALDRNNRVVSTSKVTHVATKGSKNGNYKKVAISKSVIKKAKKLKKGKSLKLKAKAVPRSRKLKVKKHVAVRYESTNTNIATVSKKGVVKAKNKGACYVYAYAQNGVCKKIKVVVR